MTCDLHVHVAGVDQRRNGNFVGPSQRRRCLFRLLKRRLGVSAEDIRAGRAEEVIARRTLGWLAQSSLGRAVLLALDPVYRRDGFLDWASTRLATGNDYVAELARGHVKALFGASIHPYRRDAVAELERLLARGACLVKWLPSAQGIDPADPVCTPFYEALAHHRVPLLSHAGIEHTVTGGDDGLNHPRRLEPALRRGVTVIAAHCGTRLYLHERSHFAAWRQMALAHENFYGDVSGFALPNHGGPLGAILRDPILLSKVLYGSDFPALALPLWYLFRLGPRQALRLAREKNPFDKAYRTLEGQGLPAEVFRRAFRLLRLPSGTFGATAEAV